MTWYVLVQEEQGNVLDYETKRWLLLFQKWAGIHSPRDQSYWHGYAESRLAMFSRRLTSRT
jgi:hypothetical protein